VRVLPGGGWHPWVYAWLMPLRHAAAFRACRVLRVFQITGVIPALVARRRYGVPFVTTYGFWYAKLARSAASRRLRDVVERWGLGAADAVIVTTPELGAHVATRAPRERIHLIPNGVDTARFRPGPPRVSTTRNVAYVGRLSAEKNLGTLLDAAGKLAGRFELRVTFIGQGACRGELLARARQLGVRVEFLPVVDNAELPRFLTEADAFVLPSFTEGHPKVLLEAMACGVPCVASGVDGNRAIVEDGVTGLLFEPRDAGGLAERLERVLQRDDFTRRMGERARAAIVERYDLAALVAHEIELLRSVARP
jgi:glycosyltransferase involved in cell wall biosynthesis